MHTNGKRTLPKTTHQRPHRPRNHPDSWSLRDDVGSYCVRSRSRLIPVVAQLQACFTAIPISATFWFACNMFMLVLIDQRKQKQK